MKTFSLLGATCLLALMHHTAGYSTGAPDTACGDLVPQHKVPAQKKQSPYVITVNKRAIKGGESVKITITGKNGEKIKGFLCQARVGETPVGHFRKTNGFKVFDCDPGQQNAVTHTDAEDKPKVEVDWVAPEKLAERVKIVCTIVQRGDIFWVGENSETISVN